MSERHWNDGQPFYCILCGAGYGEYMACELPDCKLESEYEARQRTPQAERETRKQLRKMQQLGNK